MSMFFMTPPDAMLLSKSPPWYTRWGRDKGEIHTDIATAMHRVRQAAQERDQIPKFKGKVIKSALALTQSNRAVSLEFQACGDLKELPLEAFEDLALVFDAIAHEGTWPMNGSFVPVSLIPKPDGGDRPHRRTPPYVLHFL